MTHLLTSFGCAEYKPFGTATSGELPCQVELRPLTFLFGKNNSGKSTVLRLPLLLLEMLQARGDARLPLTVGKLRFGDTPFDLFHGRDSFRIPSFRVTLNNGKEHKLSWGFWGKNRESAPSLHAWSYCSDSIHKQRDFDIRTGTLGGDELLDGLLPEGPLCHEELARALLFTQYLGPLRANINSSYSITSSTQVDANGRGTAQLLAGHPELLERVQQRFHDLIPDWSLNLRREGSSFHLTVNNRHMEINAAAAGQGIHQLLPVLTLCEQHHVTRDPELLIIEQPELHLHDVAQAPIGDLLINAATKGNGSILVETHSEALFLRVRRRIAEGKFNSKDLRVYFVDSTAAGATIKEVRVDERGALDWWPEGVFSERYEEVKRLQRARREN